MDRLLVRVLFAVSTKSDDSQNPLTSVLKFPTIPVVLEDGTPYRSQGALQG